MEDMKELDILVPKKIKIAVGERIVEVPPLSIKRYIAFMRVFNGYLDEIINGQDISKYIVQGAEIAAKGVAVAIGEDEEKVMDELYPVQAADGVKKILKQNQIEQTLKNTIAMVVPEKVVPSQPHSNFSPKNTAGRSKKLKK